MLWNIFSFPHIGNNHPNWLIFFRGVETTNQYIGRDVDYTCCSNPLWEALETSQYNGLIRILWWITLIWNPKIMTNRLLPTKLVAKRHIYRWFSYWRWSISSLQILSFLAFVVDSMFLSSKNIHQLQQLFELQVRGYGCQWHPQTRRLFELLGRQVESLFNAGTKWCPHS